MLPGSDSKDLKPTPSSEAIGLNEKLKQIDDRSEVWTDLAVDTFSFAYASHHYENGDTETRRSVLLGLGANLTVRDKKLLISLPPHLEAIRKAHKLIINVNLRCETVNIDLDYKKTGHLEPVFSKMLPGSDSNRRPID